MSELWAFVADPANQATLAWLGGGLVTFAGGLWTVVTYFRPRPAAPAPTARSPLPLAMFGAGLVALVAAFLLAGDRQQVGTGIINPGTIEGSTITIQGAPR